jgi:curved DNA-binding protein CbpA
MSAIRKDYYKILGVIETADPAVIRAAYKVMIGIYHPDKYIGDKDEAVKKSKEINEAFSVLSDTEKRKAYDEKLKKEKVQYEPEADQESDDVRGSKNKALNEAWKLAVEYVSGLDSLYEDLYMLSPLVAFTFKLEMLEKREFLNAKRVARNFKAEFYRRFFGSNLKVQLCAEWFLVNEYRYIAKELNKIVTTLGDDIEVNVVIKKLLEKHRVNSCDKEDLYSFLELKEKEKEKEKPSGCTVFIVYGCILLGVAILISNIISSLSS